MNVSLLGRKALVIFALTWLLPLGVLASEQIETDDFHVVHARTMALGEQYGPKHVLLIFDVDNTLLAMNQALGSDPWFGWQAGLIRANPCAPELVGRTFDELLRVQRLLFALSGMHPPQAETPGLIVDLQARGFTTLVLTARGYRMRDTTRRELEVNGYDFVKRALPPAMGYGGIFPPYDPDDPAGAGLTADEVARFKLDRPRAVSYMEGVYMVAGQHKGAMLRALLHKTGRHFATILFADDHRHNTDDMYEAFVDAGADITVVPYGGTDPDVRAFREGGRAQAVADWRRLRETLETVFR